MKFSLHLRYVTQFMTHINFKIFTMLRLAVSTGKERRSILNFLSRRVQKKKPVEMDTTDYLLSNPIDKERLLQAMDDFENNRSVFIQRDLIEL